MTGQIAAHVQRQAVYELVVDGRSIDKAVRPRLHSLSLTERRGTEADELEIVLNDTDGKLGIPPAGATVTLKLGWLDLRDGAAPVLIDKGSFTVDERGHAGTPDRLTIRARSANLTRAFRTRQTRTWSNTTLGAVLDDVAVRNGLQARVAADKASIAVDHLTQDSESDSALLARLGRLHDAVATIKAGRLIFAAIASGQTATGQPIPEARITRSDGDRHTWSSAERENYSGVIAKWRNRSTNTSGEVVIGSSSNAKRLGRTYGSESSARRAAETENTRQDRKGARFSLDLASGRPDLYPDRKLTVTGWKADIDNTGWVITEVTHQLDAAGGLKTALQMEINPKPPSAAGAT
ncbi:contractile injection system protein, VgrG/Pvc8 family [Brevundimonas sp.]|uniref:contractile injection system protein, VgrG/Pvc8 family n=1 Tax=Brevundimonas sp. TaxID=1871086 RepID=UPI0025BDF2BE|nr:contractile injection system protein, VgrG/Pvc8 family [Brevundimonas sp.]